MFTFFISSSVCSFCLYPRGNKLDKDTVHIDFHWLACVIFVHIVSKVHLYFSTERTKILQIFPYTCRVKAQLYEEAVAVKYN